MQAIQKYRRYYCTHCETFIFDATSESENLRIINPNYVDTCSLCANPVNVEWISKEEYDSLSIKYGTGEVDKKPLSAEEIADLLGAEIIGKCNCNMDPISIMGLPDIYKKLSAESYEE